MDVAESPDRDPRSPEDEEEEQPGLSDDDILRESGSEQGVEPAEGRASDLEEEESRSEGDQDSEAQEQSRGPMSPPRVEEGDPGEEDRVSDLRDEASSVTRELDEHELDYDEEVPEEPAPVVQEEEAEDKGDGAPGEQGPAAVLDAAEQEPAEVGKEKKKEDDDGEIDDGEIDVSDGWARNGASGRHPQRRAESKEVVLRSVGTGALWPEPGLHVWTPFRELPRPLPQD